MLFLNLLLTAAVLLIVLSILATEAKSLFIAIVTRFCIAPDLVAVHRRMRVRLITKSATSALFCLGIAFLLSCDLARLVMSA